MISRSIDATIHLKIFGRNWCINLLSRQFFSISHTSSCKSQQSRRFRSSVYVFYVVFLSILDTLKLAQSVLNKFTKIINIFSRAPKTRRRPTPSPRSWSGCPTPWRCTSSSPPTPAGRGQRSGTGLPGTWRPCQGYPSQKVNHLFKIIVVTINCHLPRIT